MCADLCLETPAGGLEWGILHVVGSNLDLACLYDLENTNQDKESLWYPLSMLVYGGRRRGTHGLGFRWKLGLRCLEVPRKLCMVALAHVVRFCGSM